jgi:hypothetical protein
VIERTRLNTLHGLKQILPRLSMLQIRPNVVQLLSDLDEKSPPPLFPE